MEVLLKKLAQCLVLTARPNLTRKEILLIRYDTVNLKTWTAGHNLIIKGENSTVFRSYFYDSLSGRLQKTTKEAF
jgi:hypothetical protein